MNFLILKTTDPYTNLAIEEYFFNNSDEDYFILWQNEPSVIIGKNQNAYAEINMEYARKNNLHIVRRITGGGAVYHDLGNVNYTFISSREKNAGIDFECFTLPIIEALKNLGIDAKLSGRNDLVVDGKKFSGNAQHRVGNRILHHGTMLFDSDLEVLSKVLNVDDEKLKSKSIKSVRSRVINLKSILPDKIDTRKFIDILAAYVIERFSPTVLLPPDNEEVAMIIRKNKSIDWIYPDREFLSGYSIVKKKKYDFGLVEITMMMSNDKISDIKIFGDFFGVKEISELEELIKGHSIFEIENLLKNIPIKNYIFGMSDNEFFEHITH